MSVINVIQIKATKLFYLSFDLSFDLRPVADNLMHIQDMNKGTFR